MNNKNKFAVLAFTLCTAFSSSSSTTDIQTCLLIENADKRLACFDKVAKSQQKQVEVIVEEKEDEPKTNIAESGTKLATGGKGLLPEAEKPKDTSTSIVESKIAEFGSESIEKEAEPELDSIFMLVKKVDKSIRGRLKLTFENGQYWEQTDTAQMTIKPGDNIEISKGVWSVYYLKKATSNRKIKVKRIK